MNQQLEFDIETKEDVAIALIRKWAPKDKPYQVSTSFGKDSIVVTDLVIRSGVPADFVHNQTGIDPPELVKFGREHYPFVTWEKPKYSIWTGIKKKGLPKRLGRWCCEVLKEYSGKGRFVITGIRAAESSRRRMRSQVELETRNNKSFLHPIFGWTEADVWDYIREHNLPYCELYDIPSWNRIGCVMCPLMSWQKTLRDWQRYPKFADAWYRAASRYHRRAYPLWVSKGNESATKLPTPEALWWWWLTRGQTNECVIRVWAEYMGLKIPEVTLPERAECANGDNEGGKMTKLHLGCGNVRLEDFINIDSRKTPATDMLMDIAELSFSDNSIDVIYCCNVLEHISYLIVPDILKEWHRVLCQGGELILRVPDLDINIVNYIKGRIYHFGKDIWNDNYMGEILGGGQGYETSFHKSFFTYEYLKGILLNVGFSKVQRVNKRYFPVKDSSAHPATMTLVCIKEMGMK